MKGGGKVGTGGLRETLCSTVPTSPHQGREPQPAMPKPQAWEPSHLPWLEPSLVMPVLSPVAGGASASQLTHCSLSVDREESCFLSVFNSFFFYLIDFTVYNNYIKPLIPTQPCQIHLELMICTYSRFFIPWRKCTFFTRCHRMILIEPTQIQPFVSVFLHAPYFSQPRPACLHKKV